MFIHFSPLRNAPIRYPGVATALFERANAIEGQNPREANELRVSAMGQLVDQPRLGECAWHAHSSEPA